MDCVATLEVGSDNLCEITDGRPSGINTLISHMREMVFPLSQHESKELFHQYCRLEDHYPDKAERV